jgi:uncharacterized membrane protein YesL
MKNSCKIFYRGLFDAYSSLGFSIGVSILWLLSIIPIITVGPATGALLSIIKLKKTGYPVHFFDFWREMRKFGTKGLLLSLIYVLIVVPAIFYMIYLYSFHSLWLQLIGTMIFYLFIIANLLYLYVFTIMVEQGIESITIVFKRAYRLLIENFMFSIQLALFIILIIFVTVMIPILLFITPVWIAYSIYIALMFLLQRYDDEAYKVDLTVNWKGVWKSWRE